MNVFMPTQDIATIERHLNKDDIMLEWGAGGSTLYFSKLVKEYHSIEHNKEWFDKVHSRAGNNVTMYYVEQNHPHTVPAQEYQFVDYIKQIKKIGIKFDKILIDGRVRFFCAEIAKDYLKEDGKLFIHDWVREWYHSALIWYELIEKSRPLDYNSGSVAVLRRRQYA